uniref:Uncharacterized protein n=1 Tax=Arion vulgaris TaxID=1028688 RepID=A0A0B6Y8J6_9EUPU
MFTPFSQTHLLFSTAFLKLDLLSYFDQCLLSYTEAMQPGSIDHWFSETGFYHFIHCILSVSVNLFIGQCTASQIV